MPEPVAPEPGATGSALPDAAISSGDPAIPTDADDRLDWPAWLDSLPISEYGFPGPLRDKLLAALLSGAKTTTSSLHEGYPIWGEELPVVGAVQAVLDSRGERVFATEVVDVKVLRMGLVSDEFAAAEGEGYQNAAQWRASHEAFWLSDASVEELGYTPQLSDDTLVVLETVRVIGASQTLDDGDAAAR